MNDSTLFILIIASICIIVAIALGIIVLFNITQKQLLVETQKRHDNNMRLQKMLLENTVTVQEKERNRISRELHDNIGSQLSIMNLSLNVLKSLTKFNENELMIIEQISNSLASSIETTRNISHELFPATITKFGINTALQALATSINKTGQIRVDMDIPHEWEQIDKSNFIHIFRIVQELINNTIKHANAQNIIFKSWEEGSHIMITYLDDGIGLSENFSDKNGIGIGNIHTRIGLLNGEIALGSTKSKGFEAKISIPFIDPTKSKNGKEV